MIKIQSRDIIPDVGGLNDICAYYLSLFYYLIVKEKVYMRKRLLGRVLVLALIVLSVGVNILPVKAGQITKTKSAPAGVSFKKAWERTTDICISGTGNQVGELCYGYNTVSINEDYVWTRSVLYSHKSKVKNKKGTYTSSVKRKSSGPTWAKIEVNHKGDSGQKYSIVFTNVSNEYASSDFTKSNTRSTNNKKK